MSDMIIKVKNNEDFFWFGCVLGILGLVRCIFLYFFGYFCMLESDL